nr:MAG TPA: hypothetical protein [Bacteriophage sp.]DAV98652.1 MAG TPA: hypothetical protein [Caudoviricetes sp.]
MSTQKETSLVCVDILALIVLQLINLFGTIYI